MGNLNVVMINVTSRDDGLRVLDRVDAATETGEINVEDVAMVYKNDKGKVKIHQTADATAGKGAVKGGGLGLLVGIFAAPLVPAVAVGAGIGALVGKARDRGISDDLIKQAGQAIETSWCGRLRARRPGQHPSHHQAHRRGRRRRRQGGVPGPLRGCAGPASHAAQGGGKVAVGVQLDFKGMTLEQYDEAVKRMGFSPRGAGAPGSVFHWVTKTADGVRVTDVWETQEDFEKFAQEKIGPITQAVGIKGQPEIQYFDVHNYLTAG